MCFCTIKTIRKNCFLLLKGKRSPDLEFQTRSGLIPDDKDFTSSLFSAESLAIVFSWRCFSSSKDLTRDWHSPSSAETDPRRKVLSERSVSVAASFSFVLMHSCTDCSKSLFRTLIWLAWFSDVSCNESYSVGKKSWKQWKPLNVITVKCYQPLNG